MMFRILMPIALLTVATIAMADTYEEGGVVTKKEKSMATKSEGAFSRIIPEVSFISATAAGNDAQGVSNNSGFGLGVMLDVGHSNAVLETGLAYRQEGVAINTTFFGNASLNLNYLAIPVLGKYYFSGQDDSSLFIKGGLMPSILVSQSVTALGQTVSVSNTGVNTFDLLATAGLGGKIALDGGTDLILEADYARGLIKWTNNADLYNSDITVTAGIGISL